MASTTFIDRQTPIVASWLNDVNDAIYKATEDIDAAGARTLQDKMTDIVHLKDFWRSGEGSDYSNAFQRMLDSGEPVCSGGGGEYTVAGSFTGRGNLILRDISLTAPGLSSSAYIIDFSGTDGTAQTLAGDVTAGATSITVPDGTAFSEDGWAWVNSSASWSTGIGDGELVQILSISGNDLTLYGPILQSFTVANSAKITPIQTLDNIVLENVNLTGPLSTGNQGALRFNRCYGVVLNNVKSKEFDYTHIYVDRTAVFRMNGGRVTRTGATEGLDYGVAFVRGCFDGLVYGLEGHAMRHMVTVGGSSGVSRFITADGCRGTGLLEAALDSHVACHEHSFINGDFTFAAAAGTGCDGIMSQGSNPFISNIRLRGPRRHGVIWQPMVLSTAGVKMTGTIEKIEAFRGTAGSTGGAVTLTTDTTGIGEVNSITIRDIKGSGFNYNVLVDADQAVIRNVVIDEAVTLTPALSRSVYVSATSTSNVENLTLKGGTHEVDAASTQPCIDIFGSGSGRIKNVRLFAPHLKRGAGGTIGIRLGQCDNVTEIGTTADNITTKYSVDTSSTGYVLDRRASGVTTYSAGVAYTVTQTDVCIIVNRAATVTLTLPDATKCTGRDIFVKTIQAQAVDSASANVAPIGDSTAGTSILPATDGAWAMLRSNGTNWVVMQRGT